MKTFKAVKLDDSPYLVTNAPRKGDEYIAIVVKRDGKIKGYVDPGGRVLSVGFLKKRPVWYVKEYASPQVEESREFFEPLGFEVSMLTKKY